MTNEQESAGRCPGCGAPEEQQEIVTGFQIGQAVITVMQCAKCKAVYDPALVGTEHYEGRFKPTPDNDAKAESGEIRSAKGQKGAR